MPYRNSRVDKVLTNISLKYEPQGFICDMALTPLPVMKWSGIIASYGNAHLQLINTRVFDRGEYKVVPTVDRNLSNTYRIGNHGVRDYVTERDREEVEQPFDARRDVTRGLRNLLITEKEFAMQALLRNPANYPTTNKIQKSGTGQWNDAANSTPLQDIKVAKAAIFTQSKRMANAAIIPYDVLENLRFHPTVTDKYGASGQMKYASVEAVKAAIGIENIYVPMAAYVNSAGVETLFWGKDVIIYNRASGPMKDQRTFGYKLTKTGHESRVYSYQPEGIPNSDVILSDMAYQFQVLNYNAGYIIRDAIA